jgi:hypothetical protein
MSEIEFWVSGEWTMVYLDGQLQRAGDSYLADEWLQERCGVKVIQDDAGVCIPDGKALKTLTEARAAMAAREQRLGAASNFRIEAARLLADADSLETQK